MKKSKFYIGMTDDEIFEEFAHCKNCGAKMAYCKCRICEPIAMMEQCKDMMQKARSEGRKRARIKREEEES